MITLFILSQGKDTSLEVEKEIIPLLGTVYEIESIKFDGSVWMVRFNYEINLLLGIKIEWTPRPPKPITFSEKDFDRVLTVSRDKKPVGMPMKLFFLNQFSKVMEEYDLVTAKVELVPSVWEEF